MATTLKELRSNISDAINASKDADGQLPYRAVIDILKIEAQVAVAEQLRMANLLRIVKMAGYKRELPIYDEIETYVRRELGEWGSEEDDEEGDDDDS